MKLLSLLFPLVGLICLVAYVWLLTVAFKKSAVWGLAVLFLSPFAAVALAVRHWQDSKKPFLIYAGSTAGLFVLLIAMFFGLGGAAMMEASRQMEAGTFTEEDAHKLMVDQMDRIENSGMLDRKGRADLNQMREFLDENQPGTEADAVEAASTSPAGTDLTDDANTNSTIDANAVGSATTVSYTNSDVQPLLVDPSEIVNGFRAIPTSQAQDFLGEYVRIVGSDGKERRGTLLRVGRNTLVLEKHIRAGTFAFEFSRRDIRSMHVAYQ